MPNPCPKENCKGELMLQQRKPFISVAGVIGALVAVIGVALLFVNPIVGVLMLIGGVLFGHFGAKATYAVCPLCGYSKKVPGS